MRAHRTTNDLGIKSARRRGFTLVELLVVICIIAVLASAIMFAMMGAIAEGKRVRTNTQIERINDIIAVKWEAYMTRRVPIDIPSGTGPRAASRLRLDALHELMRMEMPDRISDVKNGPAVLRERPSLNAAYNRRKDANGGTWSPQYQGAECLYMIVALTRDGTRNGLEFFSENEIGDKDNDGMPEIHDGWGNPIEFLRWAPGVESPLQSRDVEENPDPFDPLPRGATANYGLFPYIFSAGNDGKYGIATDIDGAPVSYSGTSPSNNPYESWAGSTQFGAPIDVSTGEHFDNITNHSREQ